MSTLLDPSNECADLLAKEGAELDPHELDIEAEVLKAYFKGRIKDNLLKDWNTTWKNHLHCRQTKIFLPEVDPGFSKVICKLDRRSLSLAIQAITGHNLLRYHQ